MDHVIPHMVNNHNVTNGIGASESESIMAALKEACLTSDDVFKVFGELYPARRKWYNFGGVLNVKPEDLDAISSQHSDLGDRLRETLKYRLKCLPQLTWSEIISALRNVTVGEVELAQKLAVTYCPSKVVDPMSIPEGNTLKLDGIFATRPTMSQIHLIKWDKDGKIKHLRVMENIAHKWKSLGTIFGIPEPVLIGFQRQSMGNQDDCLCDVIRKWMESGSRPDRETYPFTWDGFIRALRDIALDEVADDLIQALPRKK